MVKQLYNYHGVIYRIKTDFTGHDRYVPIAIDQDCNPVVENLWRWEYKLKDFQWSIVRYLNKKYGLDLSYFDIYLIPDNITVKEAKNG